ncbi:MAG: LysR family transcriptional regulator [Erysipelotrichaceae bacterium]|nr:LysR family transcriptional regulator [Erysipelotrichaceae bacterium]
MTLQQILYALTIASEGSMNKAAEKLYISQPTLTSSIKQLEEELNITIFNRTNKGIAVTAEGKDFLANARSIYTQYEMLEEKYGPKGSVKRNFGVSCQHYSFATKAFVNMVKKYGYDSLNFSFAIKETKTHNVIDDVAEGRSDVGVLYLSNYNQKYIKKLLDTNGLEFHFLYNCTAQVYLYKNHPLAKEKSITLKQLQDYPCMSFEQGSQEVSYLAEEILVENTYARTIKVNDRATMLNLMQGLNGYTLCSGVIYNEFNGDDYIAVPYQADDDNPNAEMQLGYITRKNTINSKIAEDYIEELKNYFK